jgi:hypothetical protein
MATELAAIQRFAQRVHAVVGWHSEFYINSEKLADAAVYEVLHPAIPTTVISTYSSTTISTHQTPSPIHCHYSFHAEISNRSNVLRAPSFHDCWHHECVSHLRHVIHMTSIAYCGYDRVLIKSNDNSLLNFIVIFVSGDD